MYREVQHKLPALTPRQAHDLLLTVKGLQEALNFTESGLKHHLEAVGYKPRVQARR